MSKTVTIPTDGMNPFVVIFNGVKYVYTPGETVEVPDGVALEIEEYKRWREKHPGENVPPFGVQPDWNQNDPNAPDFVKNRTHYTKLMYSDTYIDYFDVSPIKAGMGLFPLVIPKEGKESFDFKAFFDPDFLQRAYTTSGRRMKFAINNILKNSASNTSSTMNSASAFLNKRTFIDDKNFMVAINPTNGFDIYAICDTSTLTDSYKDMFAKKGVYLHITKEPTVNSGYYFDSVSFKVLEYVPIDEGYIPLNVPRVNSKAAVGQTVVVKSVNSAGQPTEWEAVNAGEKWETIAEFTVEESAHTFEIDEDLNGENFRLRKAVVVIENVSNGKEGYEDNNTGVRVFIRSKPFDGTYEAMNREFVREGVNTSYNNPYIEGSVAKGKYFITVIEVNDAYWSTIIKTATTTISERIDAPNRIGSRIGGISIQTSNYNVNAYGVGTNIRIMGVRE